MNTKNKEKFSVGMVFWTFDIFHPWHQFYISEAKSRVEKLLVVVARDARVIKVKHQIPLNDEKSRVQTIQNFDKDLVVMLGDEEDIFLPIVTYQPDILFFWYDQNVPEDILKKKFPHIKTQRIGAFFPETFKSSILRKNF